VVLVLHGGKDDQQQQQLHGKFVHLRLPEKQPIFFYIYVKQNLPAYSLAEFDLTTHGSASRENTSH
jgi:hypothetical protein